VCLAIFLQAKTLDVGVGGNPLGLGGGGYLLYSHGAKLLESDPHKLLQQQLPLPACWQPQSEWNSRSSSL
jgi:hypothetical protein